MESKNFIIIEFLEILISKNECKMILMIITKNYAADPEIRFSTKSILRPFGPTSPFGQRGSSNFEPGFRLTFEIGGLRFLTMKILKSGEI